MTRLSGIRAISFDVDGTLWDFDGTTQRSLESTLLELRRIDQQAATSLNVKVLVELRDRAHDEVRGVVTDLNEVRRESFKRALKETGRPDDALGSHLFDVYKRHQTAGKVPFVDVRPALEQLAQRYALGLVSNGNSYARDFGLEDLIGFEVFGQDHGGIEKPDPRMFQIALGEAGCAAAELVHVGDSLETDVEGARSAGARGVWLNRNGAAADRGVTPEYEISTLRELLDIL